MSAKIESPSISNQELLNAKSLIPKPKLRNTAVVEKEGFTRFGFKIGKVANKENGLRPIEKKKELLNVKSLIPKPKLRNTAVVEKKGFTRFGSKIEQVKAVATKSKTVKNAIEERRHVIQGVRSNQRFELLMNMRMK